MAVQAILVTGVVVDQYSWSSGFAANLGLMFNSSEWIELRGEIPICKCIQKKLSSDRQHQENCLGGYKGPWDKSCHGFYKRGLSSVKIFSGCGINITFRLVHSVDLHLEEWKTSDWEAASFPRFATTLFKSQAVEAAPGRGTNKRSNPTKDLPPPSNEVSMEAICIIFSLTNPFQMGIPTNMFGFTSDQEDVKQLPGLGVLPGLVVGAAILLGLFCISALVYGFHARRRCGGNLSVPIVTSTVFRHRWHISEEERVSFSPSRQGDSEEEVGRRQKSKTKHHKNCKCSPLSLLIEVSLWMFAKTVAIFSLTFLIELGTLREFHWWSFRGLEFSVSL